ncbi:FtsK/SpoIIIE domain-containing protein [Paractinoplanes atraurantiacus]|uniref:DNA segregation ATPase FtsK/SpoIIIE, S-DNA-T family n=1 Tax=Paractinoplanes atraurantiacus TaxID=1036182 RepID=A0A285FEB9_9ACTN|nr:FtsK/SpoIIIE domain-containing protein [Actinoplanes atraurantiacus]SNY09652.1 DNA segregation ATPase FtsK/SpoIIIE, S-DNA-T family [Actinoplanes atraurantiacus]
MSPVLVADGSGVSLQAGLPLSIFDPVYIGIDEFGDPVTLQLIYRNLLAGGLMDTGKSAIINLAVAHAALSLDCKLALFDGKQVEMGQWRPCAEVFVGPDIVHAISVLRRLQIMMDNRYSYLVACGRRKIKRTDVFVPYLIAIDEIAYFTTVAGDKKQQEDFSKLLRDLVARGRAVGIITVAATQRPSHDIIPTSLRDLFSWRFAGRCTTDSSSDVILGFGWEKKGWSATALSVDNPGSGLLIAENGSPRLVKTAYLDDRTCAAIAAYAANMRATASTHDHRTQRPVLVAA